MAERIPGFLVTCEHGGNRVPAAFRGLFAGHGDDLASHRGFDAGALALARALSRELDAPLVVATTTRLLVDANRSAHNPRVFSPLTRSLPADQRRRILREHWEPHRRAVDAALAEVAARHGSVLHIAAHTFTPVLDGRVRPADVGLLYDPSRSPEAVLCRRWRDALRRADPALRVRRNYPYRGVADGLATALRRRHPARRYCGVELELNGALAAAPGASRLRRLLARTLLAAAAGLPALARRGPRHRV